jgi:hypothetical protein
MEDLKSLLLRWTAVIVLLHHAFRAIQASLSAMLLARRWGLFLERVR